MRRQKMLTWFRAGYNQIATIFPFIVAAPRYFSGSIQLGGLMQTASAFGQVQDSLSWFVNAYTPFAEWKATVDRLITFHEATAKAADAAKSNPGVGIEANGATDVRADDVAIELPDGSALIQPFNVQFEPARSVLITGPSGSGKSTIFRALAGIWPFGRGRVALPAQARVLFLPQKPYLTIGTLREQLCYPSPGGSFNDDELRAALTDCRLEHFAGRLDENQHWAQVLSGGEQQRVAFARALLHKPEWLFMDEATSALDDATQSALYERLRERLPHTAIISIGHRTSLKRFHERALEIDKSAGGAGVLKWAN